VRQELLHIARRGGLRLLEHLVGDCAAGPGQEGLIEQAQCPGLRFTGVRLEGVLADKGHQDAILDGFTLVMRRGTVEDGNPVVGVVGPIDCGGELLMEIALGVVILGEDYNPRVVPGCRLR
jgi:hypothetical protein